MTNTVWLPGYACESWVWQELVAPLDPDAIFVDWPADPEGSFTTRESLATWVIERHLAGRSDLVLVGHSMGGVVSLDIATTLGSRVRKVMLVDSFVTSPEPFFRNLLMDSTPEPLRARVVEMLKRGREQSSEALRVALQKLDYRERLLRLPCECAAAYGDRGSPDRSLLTTALNWPAAALDRVRLHAVPNCCHFPMLENPGGMLEILRKEGILAPLHHPGEPPFSS